MAIGMPQISNVHDSHVWETIAHLDADVQVSRVCELLLVREGQEADLVQRVRSIGDELPKENLLQVIAVQMDDLDNAWLSDALL